MLLVGAALLLQSFARLQQVRLGFEPDRVITARISLPRTSYPDAARTLGFWQRLLESLDGRAGVQSAAIGTSAPFTPGVRAGGRVRDRRTASASPDGSVGAIEHVVSANYFRTLGIPVLAGRTFGAGGHARIAARDHRLGKRRARAVAGRQSDRPDDRVERCAPGRP